MKRWDEKPYYSLNYYLKQTFRKKVYRVALDAGMTCPNRDGTLGTGGCIFCSAGGSGDFAGDRRESITQQIEHGIQGLTKFHADGYIAYFQAYTNTYAPVSYLRRVYEEAVSHPLVEAVSIKGSRYGWSWDFRPCMNGRQNIFEEDILWPVLRMLFPDFGIMDWMSSSIRFWDFRERAGRT